MSCAVRHWTGLGFLMGRLGRGPKRAFFSAVGKAHARQAPSQQTCIKWVWLSSQKLEPKDLGCLCSQNVSYLF